MDDRSLLHKLVDAVSERDLKRVRAWIAHMIQEDAEADVAHVTPSTSQVIVELEAVPVDDEAISEDDLMALREARDASSPLIPVHMVETELSNN